MITKEQYETLKKYEDKLKTALYCDYARNITTQGINELNAIYKEIFNTDSSLGNGCGKCALKELKKLAQLYFDYPKEIKRMNLEKARQQKELNKQKVENNENEQD